ncbi:polysaccharide biosynthesis/export family protein [Nonlabens spongiae]|uniref:polysaccharide biosynthesis/export family protein n=1 Tax=Nonlabens spongiae TaxID=331648 RepID=UPI001FEB1C08|nr:polysaccharide biosynthesis/export family protein [Nonlabens spongiae]
MYFILITFLVVGCVSKKKILYLQDLDKTGRLNADISVYKPEVKPDDLLRILVTAKNMNAVSSFNRMVSPTLENQTRVMGQQQLFGYLVDENGYIDFPELGMLDLNNKTVSEISELIKDKIQSTYVRDEVSVDVRILNFKVTVLGEVNRPGTFTMESNRNTLLQALGIAGDLTIYGNRKDITVIREFKNEKKSVSIDLTSDDFMNSEFYFLQQNDVIIVHPNNAQVQSAGFNRNAPLFVSIASLLLSIIVILERS